MKKGKLIYSVLFFAVCLCPSVGMLIAKPETSSENRQLSEFPTLKTEEGKWNVEWLSQAGDYFHSIINCKSASPVFAFSHFTILSRFFESSIR